MALVTMDHRRFGKNLKLILDDLEISQTDFAERTQLTQAAVSMIIKGERYPGLETLCKILGVLPVTLERLLK